MAEHFPEFAVPLVNGGTVEQLVSTAGVAYERTNVGKMAIFTFNSDADFYKAGAIVSAVYDDEITGAIHKAIQGQLSYNEAVWADWEAYDFRLPGVPPPAPPAPKAAPRTLSADDVLDAYARAKQIPDPGRRKRALAYVTMLSKKLN